MATREWVCTERPSQHSLRRVRLAMSITARKRWVLEANSVTTTRPGWPARPARRAGRRRRARCPPRPRCRCWWSRSAAGARRRRRAARKRARSNCSWSVGVGSILKSPVWMMMPAGVRSASEVASAIEWVTRTGSASNGPNRVALAGRDRDQLGRTRGWVLEQTLAHQCQRVGRAVDAHRLLAQQVRDRADVIFVAVRDPERGVGAWARRAGSESRANDVGAEGMVGEGDAAVDQQTMIAVLDRHAVHADLAEATQCYQSNALCHDYRFDESSLRSGSHESRWVSSCEFASALTEPEIDRAFAGVLRAPTPMRRLLISSSLRAGCAPRPVFVAARSRKSPRRELGPRR